MALSFADIEKTFKASGPTKPVPIGRLGGDIVLCSIPADEAIALSKEQGEILNVGDEEFQEKKYTDWLRKVVKRGTVNDDGITQLFAGDAGQKTLNLMDMQTLVEVRNAIFLWNGLTVEKQAAD